MLKLNFDPFKYDWSEYFSEFAELLGIIKGIEELWNELNRYKGLEFEELEEEVRKYLLMGVDDNGYVERSVSKVYQTLLGFGVENLNDLIERMRAGSDLKTKVVVRDTSFTSFLRTLSKNIETILRMYSAITGREFRVVTKEVTLENFIDTVVELVNSIVAKLPNFDERSFFVWSLDQNTFRYLKAVYPEIDGEKGEELMKIFGLDIYFEPDVNDEKLRREYSFYKFRKESIGSILVEMFLCIYRNIKCVEILFPEIPDFSADFIRMAREALESVGWKMMNIKSRRRYDYYSKWEGYYTLSGIVLTTYVMIYKSNVKTEEVNISLFDVFDNLSPVLLLLSNLVYDVHIENHKFILYIM